uniref:VWFA domain-containing protein n=1 Tax=Panagrellus redivivus TaxID=6233 RepID=A0A7E4VZP1_PANRE
MFITSGSKLLIIISILVLSGTVSPFSTSQVFQTVLGVFKNTRFHDTQVMSALCITQYRFLQRNNGLDTREPDYFQDCPYGDWIDGFFDKIYTEGIVAAFRLYVSYPDIEAALKSNPSIHFDAESFIPGSNYNLIQSRTALFQSMRSTAVIENRINDIRKQLGQSLHTLQDFYSHTNWVELGHTDINSRVGEDASLGISLNSRNQPACKPCDTNLMTTAEKVEITSAQNDFIVDSALKLLGFSYDAVQVCHDNLITNELTTGYYSSEAVVAPKPAGKCSHGGGTDLTDTHAPAGGINKDSETVLFSPHYYLHQQAAKLATKATIRFLDDLRVALNDEETFGKIIGLTKVNAYAFVVDISASMANSYNAVKAYVKDVTELAPSGSLFYVTWFSDPNVGTVRKFNSSQYVNEYMMALVPQSGGDGPEQAYEAILRTANAVPPDTKIDVFTNAESKGGSLQQSIQNIATTKKLSINFILESTVKQAPSYRTVSTRRKRDASGVTVAGFDMYKRMAKATNGLYVLPEGIGNYTRLADVIGVGGSYETVIYEEDIQVPCGNTVSNWTIPIDDTISIVEVAMITDSETSGGLLKLDIVFTDGRGNRLSTFTESAFLSTADSRLYHFKTNQKPATYVMHVIQRECPSIPFTLNVRAQSSLTPSVQLYTSANGALVTGAPLTGESYSIVVDCASCGNITKIGISECGQNDPTVRDPVIKIENRPIWRIQNVVMPESDLLCISYAGTTALGTPFKRVHREKISPTNFEVSVKIYSNDYPGDAKVYRNSTGFIDYTIINHGTPDNFEVFVKSRRLGDIPVKMPMVFLQTNQSFYGSTEFTRSMDSDDSNFDTVDVNVARMEPPLTAVSRSADYMIVKPVVNVQPPFCNVTLNTFHESCTRQRGLPNPTYNVEVAYGGTEITPRSPTGQWQWGPASASGILSCNDPIAVYIVDERGLVGRCTSNLQSSASMNFSMVTIMVLFVLRVLL